jgi:hypothetical protein
MLQIADRAADNQLDVTVVHPIQLLDRAFSAMRQRPHEPTRQSG